MATITVVEKQIGGQVLRMETGRVAKQSHGALTVQYGDTVVLATVLSAPSSRDLDFFPLYVDYREMQYAGGKIPGGFFKREGRPSTKEILGCRLIDRTVRPMFPEDFVDEVQIQCIVVASDKNYDADVLAVIGGSAATALSHAPFIQPVAAVRVTRVDGKLILFPTYEERKKGAFDLIVAGHKDAVNMLEFGGKEVAEDIVAEAIDFGWQAVREICGMIAELVSKAGKPKQYTPTPVDEELLKVVAAAVGSKLRQAKMIKGKEERNTELGRIADEVVAALCPADAAELKWQPADVRGAVQEIERKAQRGLLMQGIRPDGRKVDEVRPITIDVPALPRVHGSALFSRGETQSLGIVTLGTPRDQQKIEGLEEEYFKRFMLHYNFPPFSVGEIRPVRGPGRRDIGHGALAEKSLEAIIPPVETFPYTVRVVSEILESNGSSSMASVCSGCLAMMDAGVPIKNPVAGVSIGLIREAGKTILLTDIIGEEDFGGEMDFKVAGTRDGITGIQLDVKLAIGITQDIVRKTLTQAREARLHILAEMAKALAAPRPDISPTAPRLITIHIDPEKIGKVIGPGGKMINALSTKHEVTIDIEDDGSVFIAGADGQKVKQCAAEIEAMTAELKVGSVYTGKVVGIKDFGAFVELAPGVDGLCHVSELDEKFVKNVGDVCKLGDILTVKIIAIDDQGRVKLSRKAILREEKGK